MLVRAARRVEIEHQYIRLLRGPADGQTYLRNLWAGRARMRATSRRRSVFYATAEWARPRLLQMRPAGVRSNDRAELTAHSSSVRDQTGPGAPPPVCRVPTSFPRMGVMEPIAELSQRVRRTSDIDPSPAHERRQRTANLSPRGWRRLSGTPPRIGRPTPPAACDDPVGGVTDRNTAP